MSIKLWLNPNFSTTISTTHWWFGTFFLIQLGISLYPNRRTHIFWEWYTTNQERMIAIICPKTSPGKRVPKQCVGWNWERTQYHQYHFGAHISKHSDLRISGWWFGTWIFYFPIYWELHHPNWRTLIFFRGVGIPTTNQVDIIGWLITSDLRKVSDCVSDYIPRGPEYV